MKTIYIATLLLIFGTIERVNSMENLFKNPPRENRMLQIIHCYYSKELAEILDKSGYGGVVANVGHENYLESEEQWQAFLKCLDDFRKRGMVFWIYDEKGYPSGKAAGLTLRDHPEYEALGVLYAETEGNGTIHHKMPAGERVMGTISALAVPVQDGKYDLNKKVDLTDKVKPEQSELLWDAPDGNWRIMSFHVSRMYEGTHCVTNYSDPLPYINIIDRDAVAYFIKLTHDAYKQRCGDAINDYVQAFFTDEPSLMTLYLKKDDGLLSPIPWNRNFPEEFKARMGYEIIPKLPYLFVDCGEETIYTRLHFWKVVSELVEEYFYGQIQDWCRANGVASSGHALWEEHIFWHVGFEGDLYRDLRRMDIPGIDMLSSNPTQLARANHIPIPKFVSSVTHLSGAELCMSETSSHVQTVSKLPCSFEQRLGTINWQYVLGLTCVTSYYGVKEFSDEERKIFNEHIGRLGFMLTGGRHLADIAVFYPIHTAWRLFTPTNDIAQSGPHGEKAQRLNREFGTLSVELLANQRDFDYIDDQAIIESQIKDGRMEVAGESFISVILPDTWVIPANVYRKLEKFVDSGSSIVALGGLPETGMSKNETSVVRDISGRLSKSDRVSVIQNVPEVVKAVSKFTQPDISLDKPCRELLYLHYQKDGKDIYFISNSLDSTIQREITLNCKGKPQIWHPTTGEIKDIDYETKGEKTIIKIDLKAFEGVLVVF